MIDISELLSADRIRCKCSIQSKKRALQTLGELFSPHVFDDTLSDMCIFDALVNRERLGSTSLGHGIALPHSRLASIEKPIAALITLQKGIDYDTLDGEPVDIVFGLLVPENCNDEHLKILANLAKRFSKAEFRDSIRTFNSNEALLKHLKSSETVEN